MNTPKLQVPTPEFGHGARARVQGLDLVLGHYMVLGALEFPVSKHNTIFFGAQAPILGHQIERFSIERRKTKTKVITLANHQSHKHYSEPIKTRSNYM